MIRQTTFHLSSKRRGCHLVTQEILENLPKPLPQAGMLNLFVQHTSCALTGEPVYSVYAARQEHPNAFNVWTAEDDAEVRQMWADGKSVHDIAEHFGRKDSAIISRMKKLKI